MPADEAGTYESVIVEDTEHLFPVGDGAHEPRSTCACEPLRVENFKGWLHRVMAPPL